MSGTIRITSQEKKMECLVSFSTPGKWDKFLMGDIDKLFHRYDIKLNSVDTMLGWGNLNQDWLEGKMEIETSWGWCRPMCLTEDEWTWLFDQLEAGRLLMMVYYKEGDEYIPHH